MLPIVTTLISNGLSLLANAFLAKGKDYIQEKTGVNLDNAALSNSDLLKLKQFELENEKELMQLKHEDNKLDAEIEKAYLADRQSARSMQMEALKQGDVFSKRFIYYYAIAWTVFAFGYMSAVSFFDIPDKSVRLVDTILGFLLGTALGGILAFFFGSSSGSKDKDSHIPALINAVKEMAKK